MYTSFCKFLDSPISSLPGIGEKTLKAFSRLHLNQITDLIWHLPSKVIPRKIFPAIPAINQNDQVVLQVEVANISLASGYTSRKKPFKISCFNQTGSITLIFFNYIPHYHLKWLKIGSKITIIGKVDIFNFEKQIAHAEIINSAIGTTQDYAQEIIYPLTYGITSKQLQKIILYSIKQLPSDLEWLGEEILLKYHWPSFNYAINQLHSALQLDNTYAISRLAYDEFLANQLMMNLNRNLKNQRSGKKLVFSEKLMQSFIDHLPFKLTHGQNQCLTAVIKDQKAVQKMSRLIQGDVGCGKTIIAFCALINTVEAGYQGALMAPTDVLATQHYDNALKLFANLNINIELLTGKTKKKEKIYQKLQNGEIDILIGTHAVFQDKVIYKNLALVVIDEQHRFGVNQRLTLTLKGENPDLLIMSATPIPRTLSLALYGDMEQTSILDKPLNRKAIATSIMNENKIEEITQTLTKLIKQNEKIYWICPLIEENDDEQVLNNKTSVEKRFEYLKQYYPGMVGYLHGKLDSSEKLDILAKFKNGELKILVSTTVIEVGVDVPDATLIVIENAESFGLAQLHQLRGRVGRSDKQSYCILVHGRNLSQTAMQRLRILRESNDGFYLAEQDLKLRGSGELIGTKQSGVPDFKIADLSQHFELLKLATNHAKGILQNDPFLNNPKNAHYKILLKLFSFNYSNLDW